MNTATIIYLAGLSENLAAVALVSAFFLILIGIVLSIDREEVQKRIFVWAFIVVFLAALMPSRTTVLAAYIVSDNRVQNITDQTLDLIEKKLEDMQEE